MVVGLISFVGCHFVCWFVLRVLRTWNVPFLVAIEVKVLIYMWCALFVLNWAQKQA